LSIIDQANATIIRRVLRDSAGAAPGAKSDVYDCLVFVLLPEFL